MSMGRFAVPAVITVCSAVVIWVSLQLDTSPPMIVGEAMQPRAFPIFLMAINLVLVAFLVFQVRGTGNADAEVEGFPTWGSIGLLALFYPLAVHVDMFVGIAVVMFLMCLLWGERRLPVAAAVALVTPVAIFILFDKVLQVRFPRGLITNWIYG